MKETDGMYCSKLEDVSSLAVGHESLASHHLQLRVGDAERNILHELGETLVEPEVIPPLHRHQVTKPLDGKNKVHQFHAQDGRVHL